MKRIFALTSIVLTALVGGAALTPFSPAAATTAREFLNAPVWYVQYEVTLKATHQYSWEESGGTVTSTADLTRAFSSVETLNLRSEGPGALAMAAMIPGSDGSMPSAAEQQKMAMDMMSAMEHTANWIVAGDALDEGTEAPTGLVGKAATARVDYTRVEDGRDLVDETGAKFDRTRTTTLKGSGAVLAGGMSVVMLDVDTRKNSYILSLPIMFTTDETMATHEVVTIHRWRGGAAPTEHRESRQVELDTYPQTLVVDDGAAGNTGGIVQVRGTFDASTGKISGEKTFKVHYEDGGHTIPGTVVVKYTATMTPPKK